jgi:hypothetical protein
VSLFSFTLAIKVFALSPSQNFISYADNNNHAFNIIVPNKLNFCGEAIPTNNLKINRALAEEFYNNTYWKNNSAILFKRAQRWFPVIEPILKQQGVPNDFKYLAVIESHLSNVSSHAGAAGFWQLVPSSAYNFGLEVNDFIDERYHVEKSTIAACKLIKQAYSVFKNWTLTAAAYNLGINGIQKVIECQKSNNYFELLLNSETGAYVYRLLAYKTLLSTPKHFGIHKHRLYDTKNSFSFRVIKIDSSVTDMVNFSYHIGSSIKEIKQFNPWLKKEVIINPAKKVYEIKLPKKSGINYTEYLNDVVYDKSLFVNDFRIKDTFIEKSYPDTIPRIKSIIYYVVKINEPLKNLANFFKVNEDDIRKWNKLKPNEMAVKGQTLIIEY